ncbi:hypothetical protein PPACK8108_LOCUS11028 [Phakopsora pachyrhizi]|uniref:Uncharacterized protein n=1 Tax=Phakopsora pachyrhizi TaxID=170000 RepID=A0AAV0AZB3_PHAPC|nr:hypothetical protein PPACK8108_LOCUS11028 [Phakopsora pachyrhizi]
MAENQQQDESSQAEVVQLISKQPEKYQNNRTSADNHQLNLSTTNDSITTTITTVSNTTSTSTSSSSPSSLSSNSSPSSLRSDQIDQQPRPSPDKTSVIHTHSHHPDQAESTKNVPTEIETIIQQQKLQDHQVEPQDQQDVEPTSSALADNTNLTAESNPSGPSQPHSPDLSPSAILEPSTTVIQRQATQNSDLSSTNNQSSVTSNSHSILSNAKKFKASSLSVNKKFLSQSGTSDGKTLKNHFLGSPRLSGLNSTTSSISQASGPRLLTGKIGPNSSILNSCGSTSGWAKTPVVAPPISLAGGSPDTNSNPTSTSPQPQLNKAAVGGPATLPSSRDDLTLKPGPSSLPQPQPSQLSNNIIVHKQNIPAPSSNSPWGKFDNFGRNGLEKLASDFPTAQEVAQHNKLKAQSLAAANAAREKAIQERAAASAAFNQQLLQTLDGFRGTHLDPNASHWDEMEDEDDMFGEVVEFGDGTQYKVAEVPASVPDPVAPSNLSNQLGKKEERFAEDFDRTNQSASAGTTEQMPPFLRGRAELKNPVDRSKETTGPVQLLQRPSEDSCDSLSPTTATMRSRGPYNNTEDVANRRRPNSQHRSSNSGDHHSVNGPRSPFAYQREPLAYRTSLSQPLKTPQTGSSSADAVIDESLNPTAQVAERLGDEKASAEKSAQALKYRKPDLDQLHRTEMSVAADRARQRRQEEEQAREKERERARQKASEIEARLKAAATAAAEAKEAALLATSAASPSRVKTTDQQSIIHDTPAESSDNRLSKTGRTGSIDASESWRAKKVEKNDSTSSQSLRSPTHPDDRSLGEPHTRPIMSNRTPTTLLEKPSTIDQTKIISGGPSRESMSKSITPATVRATGPLPPQEEVFRKREVGNSMVWKPPKLLASSSTSSSSYSQPKPVDDFSRVASDKPDAHDRHKNQTNTTESSWRKSTTEIKATAGSDPRSLPPHMRHNPDHSSKTTPTTSVASASSPPKFSEQDSRARLVPKLEQSTLSLSSPVRSPAPQEKKAPFKLPEMSHLDTVMSRIKGALEADKEARAKAAAEAAVAAKTVVTGKAERSADSPATSVNSMAITKSVSPAVASGSLDPESQTKLLLQSSNEANKRENSTDSVSFTRGKSPSQILSSVAESSNGKKSEQPTQSISAATAATSNKSPLSHSPLVSALSKTAERKPSSARKAARFDIPSSESSASPSFTKSTTSSSTNSLLSSRSIPKPAYINRDPLALFDVTRSERSLSPAPAWKAFTVKLGASRPKPGIPSQLIKSFWNLSVPIRLNILSWEPPLANLSPRTLSRDDLLFRKKIIRGNVMSRVQLSKHRISRSESDSDSNQLNTRQGGGQPVRGRGRGISGSTQTTSSRGRVRGRADDTSSWRRAIDPVVESLTSNSSEPDSASPKSLVDNSTNISETAELKGSEIDLGKRRGKSKIPEGVKVAFSKPPFALPLMIPLHLECSKTSSPLHSSVESTTVPLTPRNQQCSGPVALTPSSTLPTMVGNKSSSSPWTKSPLPFSVLDSHTKNVWAQPDGRITTSTSPSVTMENSLKGIADDFPAKLPRTLNDLDDDEDDDPGSNSRKDERASFSHSEVRPSSYGASKLPHGEESRVNESVESSRGLRTGLTTNELGSSASVNGLSQTDHIKVTSLPPYETEANNNIASGQNYHGSFSAKSPSTFQVPPGYQLVPIGSVQNNQHSQFTSRPAAYQEQAPWSPSLPALQPNGYARSPQLYSINSPYPSPAPPQPTLPPPLPSKQPQAIVPAGYSPSQSGIYPSGAVNQQAHLQGGTGFNKTPGPIAPRGSRLSVSSVHSPHSSRQSVDNSFAPTIGRNSNYPTAGKGQMNVNGGYPMAPLPGDVIANHSTGGSTAGYGGSFAPFLSTGGHPMAANQFHPIQNHAGSGGQIAGGMVGMISPQQVNHPGPTSNLMGPNSPSSHYQGPSPQAVHLPPPPPHHHNSYMTTPQSFQQTAMISPFSSNMAGNGPHSGFQQQQPHSSTRSSGVHHSSHLNGGTGVYHGNSSNRNINHNGNIGGVANHRASHHRG